MKLVGARELDELFKQFPVKVAERARKQGISRAAARYRTLIRRDAPRGRSGLLRQSIGVKRYRSGAVTIGLNRPTNGKGRNVLPKYRGVRYYYKALEFDTARGRAMHPWFERSIRRHMPAISQLMIEEAKNALYREAGKAYARSKSALRRRR